MGFLTAPDPRKRPPKTVVELYDRYHKRLILFLQGSKLCPTRQDCQDIIQDYFLGLCDNPNKFTELTQQEHWLAYLFRSVKNLALSAQEKRKRRAGIWVFFRRLEIDKKSKGSDAQFRSMLAREEFATLSQIIESEFKPVYHQVFTLTFSEQNLSVAEVAEALSLTPRKVTNFLYRIRCRLRQTK